MTQFRNASSGELSQILDWAAAEGWNPGLDDAEAFFAADPEGFFVAIEDDVPIGSISVVNHSDDFAFLGLYIVSPSFRGKVIGYSLWQHALQHAGGRTIGLDGVPDQQANYAASGFQAAGCTRRYAGHVTPVEQSNTRLAEPKEIANLIEQEAKASGVRKGAYLGAWFSNTPNRNTIIADSGFCTVRRCQNGAKIGPLVANTPEAAKALIQHAARAFGSEIVIDVPENSGALKGLCLEFDLTTVFETARMYRGGTISTDHRVYAVTSLELG